MIRPAVPSGDGTVEDNSHPDESSWGESSLHQTRGDPRGLPGAGLAGEHGDRAGGDGPGEPGDGLGVAVVAVQLAGGDVPAERHLGEPVERLDLLEHGGNPFAGGWPWARCLVAGTGPGRG